MSRYPSTHTRTGDGQWPWRLTLRAALRASRRERGTVLLMVVGVLALLAIIGVVYATLGRADRTMSMVTVKNQRINAQAEDIAAYLASVVGDSTFAVYPEPTNGPNGPKFRERGYTGGWTDSYFCSVNPSQAPALPLAGNRYTVFSPTGTNTHEWPDPNVRDTRDYADPSLAVMEPEQIYLPGDSIAGTLAALRGRHDWRHISNFAPSGNFINLANLRTEYAGGLTAAAGFGGFSAPAGFDQPGQMSYGLTIFNRNTGQSYAPGAGTVPGAGRPPNYYIPSDWCTNQMYAFRPMADATAPNDFRYLPNQWADADGDGFADSRWFELVDVRDIKDPTNPVARSIVPAKGRLRLVLAARCVDNSGMINVVTSDDFFEAPSPPHTLVNGMTRDSTFPPGITPADIDLRRVLSLVDVNASLLRSGVAAGQLVYTGLPQPLAPLGASDPANYLAYTNANAMEIGWSSYRSIYQQRASGGPSPATMTSRGTGTPGNPVFPPSASDRKQDFDLFAADAHAGMSSAYGADRTQRAFMSPFGMSDQLELAKFWGVNDSDTLSRLEAAAAGRSSFNAASSTLSPLRDNRPRTLEMRSRDEIDGRTLFSNGGNEASPEALTDKPRILLSVFSDVRHLLTTVSGSRPIKDAGVAPNDGARGDASTDVTAALRTIREYSELQVKPATLPTTYVAAINLIFKLYLNALAPYTNNTDYKDVWPTVGALASTATFRAGLVYGGKPETAMMMAAFMTANLVDAYDRDRTLDPTTGRPNADDKNLPTVVSLRLSPDNATVPNIINNFHKKAAPLTIDTSADPLLSRRPTEIARLPSHSIYGASHTGMMNIYGTEAQPFLTEVSAFFVYTDSPSGFPGASDDEHDLTPPTPGGSPFAPPPGPGTIPNTEITIRLSPNLETNADFIGEVIAFQINNPFEQDILLFNPSAAGGNAHLSQSTFYIEYAGRYYSFGKASEDTVAYGTSTVAESTLRAGETRVFYALNPGSLKELGQRLKIINERTPPAHAGDRIQNMNSDQDYTNLAKNWLIDQFRSSSGNLGAREPQQLTQVYPTTFRAVDGQVKFFSGQSFTEMDIWGTLDLPAPNPYEDLPSVEDAERRVAQIWRRVSSTATLTQIPPPPTPVPDNGTVNNITNDQLVDRLRDPTLTGSRLYGLRPDLGDTDPKKISGTQGGRENAATAGDIGDNTGYTMVLWGAVRRPTDTLATAFGTPGGTMDAGRIQYRGVLPPWCLESKPDHDTTRTNLISGRSSFSLNKTDRITGSTDQGNQGEYGGSNAARADKFRKIFDQPRALSPPIINTELAKACSQKTKNAITAFKTNDGRQYSDVAVEFHSVGEDELGGPVNDASGNPVQGRRSRNAALFSRSGDFLLPLAIGSWFDPSRDGSVLLTNTNFNQWTSSPSPVPKIYDREAQWMTLSEALALACAYYSPDQPNDPLYQFGEQQNTGTLHDSLCDRGHLRLDRFSPYFQPQGATVPQPLGSGVPFALGVIDQFRAAVGISSTPININPGATPPAPVYRPEIQTRDVAIGGGTRLAVPQDRSSVTLIPGRLNLNSTVLTTMYPLPMVTAHPDAGAANNPWTYGSAVDNPGAKPLWDTTLTFGYDVAAAIKAYRDHDVVSAANGPTGTLADFRSTTGAAGDTSRASKTKIPNIREGRFFKSLGEIAAVNTYTGTAVQPDIADLDVNTSMFRFAKLDAVAGTLPQTATTAQRLSFWPQVSSSNFYTRLASGRIPTSGTETYTYAGQTVNHMGGTQLKDGYQDKLAIINALTNTASVRSDIFTVYFIIHGYTPEDVQVEPDQPLVPTIAKRFVMVLDRSNVVSPGDSPRILMLKEVPMP